MRTPFVTAQQPHSKDIFINQKILPLDKLINQQEGILAYKVTNGTYLLNDFLNHGDVRHQIQLSETVTVLKESDDLVIFAVTFDSKMTFEKHLRSVSRAASQILGILRKSRRVFHDRSFLGRSFRGFVLPVL